MNIAIIGTGNVATTLARKIKTTTHRIIQIFGRNLSAAEALAHEIDTDFTNEAVSITKHADLYLVCLSDSALHSLASWLNVGDRLLAHTAGSVPMNVLKGSSTNIGVLYPFQSLRKELPYLPEMPILVDAEHEHSKQKLLQLASDLSSQVSLANDQLRIKHHIAGVFVNNFTNHLYTLAETFAKEEGVDFRMLHPLINETAQRLKYESPSLLQTGPAVRNDLTTIEAQQNFLNHHPQMLRLYKALTESVMEYYNQTKSLL
jgi:predicted short-subunit dehydrogenase-like oxidoreductase (DUF2520 family)